MAQGQGEDQGAAEVSGRDDPVWVEHYLSHAYFGNCGGHSGCKGDRNHFCLDCVQGPLCPVDMRSHCGHTTLQTRKASYKDAVRVVDVQRHLDLDGIMVYSINGSKIVFLHSRPQANPPKLLPHCEMCNRAFADPVRFCSLQCKLDAIRTKPYDPALTFRIAEAQGSPVPGAEAPAPAAQPAATKKRASPGDTCGQGSKQGGRLGGTIRPALNKGGARKKKETGRDSGGAVMEQLPPKRRRRKRMQVHMEEANISRITQETQYGGLLELARQESLVVQKTSKVMEGLQGVKDATEGRKSDTAQLATTRSSVDGLGTENQVEVGGMDRVDQLSPALDVLASRGTFPALTTACSPTSVLPLQFWQGGLSDIASPTSPPTVPSSTPVSPPSESPVQSPGSSSRSLGRDPVDSPNQRSLRSSSRETATTRRRSRKGIPGRAPLR